MSERATRLKVVKPEPVPKEVRVGLFNPDFKYVRAGETDIRKTFARIRREMAAKKEKRGIK